METSFVEYVNRTDPATKPYRSHSAKKNPFYGKKIFAACGAADPLVQFDYSREFLENVVVGPARNKTAQQSLEVYVQPDVQHLVTDESTY
ncbi:hypothetical protein MOBT1_000291 [Malassezia obtusa]|uniref:Uncharacterized protein n=1 Tax=Malassezia obtusa TaxID=76774 RepID=A0AAF0DY86_9BASI|nr:hypothetical protein MOBT1_000291 [Malassezia obtusa]